MLDEGSLRVLDFSWKQPMDVEDWRRLMQAVHAMPLVTKNSRTQLRLKKKEKRKFVVATNRGFNLVFFQASSEPLLVERRGLIFCAMEFLQKIPSRSFVALASSRRLRL
jgi:hypothetical protein